MLLLVAIFLCVISFFLIKMLLKRQKLPPGPFPLPLIGNMHQLYYKMFIKKKTFIEALREWDKEYGSVHTIWFGPIALVNICDYHNAVDAMVKKGSTFADRSVPYLFDLIRNSRGIVVSNGLPWIEQRRFALHTLRNFGLGKNIIEGRIMLEFQTVCDELEKRLDAGQTSIDPHAIFELLIGNIINRILFASRFDKKEEEEFFVLKAKMDAALESFSLFDIMIDEWNINLPIFKQRAQYILRSLQLLIDFLRERVQQRRRDIELGNHVIEDGGVDFVDAFLIQMKNKDSANLTSFNEEMLVMSLFDLSLAGQQTTLSTLKWAFSYLLLNPEMSFIQIKAQVEEELLSVTKGERPLSITDRPNTPFYNATLTMSYYHYDEIHRCALIVPFNLWRNTDEDVVVGPYVIPRGTAIAAQISLIMTDEKYFKDKYKFNPKRFLNGARLEQMVVSFGLGKRACLGESLAQAELYLVIIANFLLQYIVSSDPLHMPSMKAQNELGTMRRPQPYHIVFQRRKA
ncbi:unspecific monooxygenase [Dictyocaulus viviparus]|uniref:Unspecific monooxygenase n=1 Tax=Dictyocaulus viviparus TaxID=29172 RepID=A0A0D8Y621_DICVI|nr:unspecific monooxygenase [Dictyocaulus viviparus]